VSPQDQFSLSPDTLGHALASSIVNKLDRVSWIEVKPIVGTLEQFSRGLLPVLDLRQGQLAPLDLISLAVAVCCAFGSAGALRRFLMAPSQQLPAAQGEARFLLLVIDPIKTLSQARYLIVVLPAVPSPFCW